MKKTIFYSVAGALALCSLIFSCVSERARAVDPAGRGADPSLAGTTGTSAPVVALGIEARATPGAVSPAPPSPSLLPSPSPSPTPRPRPSPVSAFYAAAKGALETRTLSNGVPLAVFRDAGAKSSALVFALRAEGAAAGKAPLDRLALRARSEGERGAPGETLAALERALSARIGLVGGDERFSFFGALAPGRNFDRALEALAERLLDPVLSESDFRKAMMAEGPATQTASFSEVKDWAGKMASADRLVVVASGALDPDALAARLETFLTRLPRSGNGTPGEPGRESIAIGSGRFDLPGPSDRRSAAYTLASWILSRVPGGPDEASTRGALVLFAENAVDAETLRAAKSSYLISFYAGRGDRLSLAAGAASAWIRSGDPLRYFEIPDDVEAVEAWELSEAARDLLAPGRIAWRGQGPE